MLDLAAMSVGLEVDVSNAKASEAWPVVVVNG
jgi:hypothetical protein